MHRVLVVEDEYPLRRILTLNLAQRGYTVAEAESVAEAEEAIEASDLGFDLILLDINLPDQTGWDILRYLEAREAAQSEPRRRPKVLVMTAVRPAQGRIDEFHPDAVLLKPFPISTFLRLVERMCDQLPASDRLARLT
jgi:DNA-binding response OmpR family regulator